MTWTEFRRLARMLYGDRAYRERMIDDLGPECGVTAEAIDDWQRCREVIPLVVQLAVQSRLFNRQRQPTMLAVRRRRGRPRKVLEAAD